MREINEQKENRRWHKITAALFIALGGLGVFAFEYQNHVSEEAVQALQQKTCFELKSLELKDALPIAKDNFLLKTGTDLYLSPQVYSSVNINGFITNMAGGVEYGQEVAVRSPLVIKGSGGDVWLGFQNPEGNSGTSCGTFKDLVFTDFTKYHHMERSGQPLAEIYPHPSAEITIRHLGNMASSSIAVESHQSKRLDDFLAANS